MSLLARSKPKWWSSLLVLVVFCLSLVQPVLAAGPTTSSDLVNLLRQYNIVRGDSSGDLQLGKPITRAEMAVILVRIMGKEASVDTMKGLGLFTDTAGHWAEGYVAAARVNGLMKGMEDGSFRPQDPVTYAQAFTMVLRLVGREPDPKNWPTSALLDAMDLNLLPPGFPGMVKINEPALRGDIFTTVATALTTIKTTDGKTYFQKWIDSTPPDLNVTATATTAESSYQLKGTAKGASQVLVNGQAATLNGESFSKTITLTVGANRVTVEATDLAGNSVSKQVVITRGSPAASLTITGPEKVQVGGTATYEIVAYNEAGEEVPATGATARVTGNIGTFDVATGTFRAGNTAGTGKIEVTLGSVKETIDVAVLGKASNASKLAVTANSGSYTKGMTVTVRVLDAAGVLVADDFGRTVSLSASGLTGVTVTPSQATTEGGIATFTVKGTTAGQVNLTATSQGLTSATGTGDLTTSTSIVLIPDQTRIPTNGTVFSKIRAELRDENGNAIANKTGADIEIDLAITGPGTLVQSRVRIAQNATNSSQTMNDGLVAPSSEVGTIQVKGTLVGSLKYTVVGATVATYTPTVGAGTKFEVVPMKSRVPMNTGVAEFLVQLVDAQGTPITGNDYAFQVQVTTSNNEEKVNGAPEGVKVYLGDSTSLNVVSDGKADGDDVIGRTENGSAVVKMTYNKPGVVTLKVVTATGTSEAYDDNGETGNSVTSQAAWITDDSQGNATFTATANTLKLTAKSELFGDDALGLNNKAGTSRTYTLTAYVAYKDPASTDPNTPRYWVPGQIKTLHLYKNGDKIASGEARDGKVTFTITASGTADTEDVYEVVDPATVLSDSNQLFVRTDGSAPMGAGVPITRGYPSNTTDQVLADDTGMEMDLPTDASQRYVIVKVYTEGGKLVYTSGPVDVSGGAPSIVVPKSALTAGVQSYYVKYKNAYGESTEKGALSYPVTNYTLSTKVTISSAKYDAVAKVLYVTGSGFATDDLVNGAELYLSDPSIPDDDPEDDDNPGIAYLSGAGVDYVSSSSIKLYLNSVTGNELAKIQNFAGSVKLSANVGWVAKSNGQMGNEDLNNAVTPMAYISHAAYDQANKTLIIYGRGFKTGTLQKDKVLVGTYPLSTTGMTVNVRSDSEIWVTLTTDARNAVEGSAAVKVTTDNGWFTDGLKTPVGQMADQGAITIFGYVRPTSVTYNNDGVITVYGSGFANGRVAAGATVKIVDEYRTGDYSITLTGGTVSADGRSVTFQVPTAQLNDFLTKYKYKVFLEASDGWFEVQVGTGYRATAGIAPRTLKFSK